MALNIQEIQEAVRSPKKSAQKQLAITHQNRIRFHTQCDIAGRGSADALFLQWVKGLISREKYEVFKRLFKYPVKTNEVASVIFDKLSRVFDGRNPAFNYQFTSTEMADYWEYYRQEVLHGSSVWSTVGWEHFKTEINSVLVVDMPEVQQGEYPKPYFYWLAIDKVIDYRIAQGSQMEWIIFKLPNDQIAVIDKDSYQVYAYQNGEVGTKIRESPHDLGYCPARFFWDRSLTLADPDVKAHPLSSVLAELDWYLYFHTSKKHLDTYACYPIYSGFAEDRQCDYMGAAQRDSEGHQQGGEVCSDGLLKDANGSYILDINGEVKKCPKCRGKIVGAGSFVTIPVPRQGEADMRNPIQITTIDRASLDYNVEEERRKRDEIINSVCGTNSELVNNVAINDKQVVASFENQSAVLNSIKKGFESIQQWTETTVSSLLFGKDNVLSISVNYGTDFYAATTTELRAQYREAKASGASEGELDALNKQILETEYRHDPVQLQRMIILADLEPYRHYSRAEVLDLNSRGMADDFSVRVKLNFSDYIRRFERENINIIEFGSAVPYTTKINTIIKTFRTYANETKESVANTNRGTNQGDISGD